MSKDTYEYNKDVCIVKSYNSSGRLESSIKYDRERKQLEYIKWKAEYDYNYDFTGMKLLYHETFKYEYDSLNNWIKSTCYSNESLHYINERKIEYS